MAKGKGITILFAIIIAGLLVFLANYSISYVYEAPQYGDFCNSTIYKPSPTQTDLDAQQVCSNEYDTAYKNYANNIFYIYAILGFALIGYGLTRNKDKDFGLQITALATGGILAIESVIKNYSNRLSVIIVLALLIGSAIYVAKKRKIF